MSLRYPPWVVLHVPHDSVLIPDYLRDQFLLNDKALAEELRRMTDHHTRALFAGNDDEVVMVRAPVSRLVVDVERFPVDDKEPMADRGMGAIYMSTADLAPLRRLLTEQERAHLMETYYWPHQKALEHAVSSKVSQHGFCLVVDCHSFPGQALPYERVDSASHRPDICIGTDSFHTPRTLADSFMQEFGAAGFAVNKDSPFSGALVPASAYIKDRRVLSVMVEVNRGVYLNEADATPAEGFRMIAKTVRNCCVRAAWTGTESHAKKRPPLFG